MTIFLYEFSSYSGVAFNHKGGRAWMQEKEIINLKRNYYYQSVWKLTLKYYMGIN